MMEKPELATKNIRYSEANEEVYYDTQGGARFILYRGGNKKVATALHSFPDLIDALYTAFLNEKMHLMEWGHTTHEGMMKLEPYRSYYKALKKAGVKFETEKAIQ